MVSSKKKKVSQTRCLRTSIESFTRSSPSEQIIVYAQFLILSAPMKLQNISNYDSQYFLCDQSLSAYGYLHLNSFYTGPWKSDQLGFLGNLGYLGFFLSDFSSSDICFLQALA